MNYEYTLLQNQHLWYGIWEVPRILTFVEGQCPSDPSMSDDQVTLYLFEEFGISDGQQLQRLDKEQRNVPAAYQQSIISNQSSIA